MDAIQEHVDPLAQRHLVLVPGLTKEKAEERCRTFCKAVNQRLRTLHRSGAGGRHICNAYAHATDQMLRFLWESAFAALSPQAQKEFPRIALVAEGGYGRGELNPCSDIDLLFLHEDQIVGSKPLPHLQQMVDWVLYALWAVKPKVGHAQRTIEECVRQANDDMKSKTALLEARLIVGDASLFDRLQKAVQQRCIQDKEDEYIAWRLEDQAERRARYGNAPTMQEPNLKNGCGGLRDYHNLRWMVQVKYGARTLDHMVASELITMNEQRHLEGAYDFLLRVRTELHYSTQRPTDVLTRDLQPGVAQRLGYLDRSPRRRIERFMHQLYDQMRTMHLITRTVEEKLALLPKPKRRAAWTSLLRRGQPRASVEIHDGFIFEDGRIRAESNHVFRDYPRRLMRVFLYAQQRGMRLHPELVTMIRDHLRLVNSPFMRDPHVRDTFLEILNQRGNVAWVVRAMHEAGLLGKYLPEFGKLTNLVQHEFYHLYAADEHTLICLEQLDRVWNAWEPPYNRYVAEFQNVEQPWILYLGLLLHDAGKACSDSDHSEAGARLVRRIAQRLQLSPPAAETVELLVRHHLLLPSVAQRLDLEDPAVIRRIAAAVRTPENLRMLALLTFADTMGTSPTLWNSFKDMLIWELFRKTHHLLAVGEEFLKAQRERKEALLKAVRQILPPEIGADELQAHFGGLDGHYFRLHSAEEVRTDLELVHAFLLQQQETDDAKALAPAVHWQDEQDRGYTVVKVCTWDRLGLFSDITGCLSASGINILHARVFSRSDGIALDTLFVTDAQTGGFVRAADRRRFEDLLTQALEPGGTEKPNYAELIRRQAVNPLGHTKSEWDLVEPRVELFNDLSDQFTVIEVEAEDHLGLLYVISSLLNSLEVNIALAKISTEKGAAVDTFYVTDRDGAKITDAERQATIKRRLVREVTKLMAE